MAIMESMWQSVKWLEVGWGGPSGLSFKLAQAQLRGGGNYSGVWRVGGLRPGAAESHGPHAVRAYLAEALSNDANEELLEGYSVSTGPTGWAHMPECLAFATLVSTHRSLFIDRTRIADGAIVYCLACVLWRQTGLLSPGPDVHDGAVQTVSATLEAHQVLYEIALLGHPQFFERPAGLARLVPPMDGGYKWIILPKVDAMSNSDVDLIVAYVRGGGRAVIIDGDGKYATGIRTEDLVTRCNTTGCGLADLKASPGSGQVVVLNSSSGVVKILADAIVAAIGNSSATVSASGLTAQQSLNAWMHGKGPMVSAHVVNFDFSAFAPWTAFNLTFDTSALKLAAAPAARLFSLDFPNETAGRPVPIVKTADGWVVTVDFSPQPTARCNYTIDPPGSIRLGMSNLLGFSPTTHPAATESAAGCAALCCITTGCGAFSLDAPWNFSRWSGCLPGAACCLLASSNVDLHPYNGTMSVTTGFISGNRPVDRQKVHAIVVVASSEAELETRKVAAEARAYLQKAVLASFSHGMRLLHGAGDPPTNPVLLAADSDLSKIQGEDAEVFVGSQMFATLRSNLTASIQKLQAVLNASQRSVGENEQSHRNDMLTLCAQPGACLVAVNFAASGKQTVPGYTTVGVATVHNVSTGFGFVNGGDAVRDARVAFETRLPDDLHRSGVFSSYASTFRLDVDLSNESAVESTLLLTVVSGFDDLGSPTTSAGMGVWGGQAIVPPAGICGGDSCGGYESKAWASMASTAIATIVRPAGSKTFAPAVPCMLGEVGRPNGYWLTRTCRINVSAAVAQSPKLQIDLVLAPQNGLTGCWSEACGKVAFAWLLNALVLQRPVAALPARARTSLNAADSSAMSAVRAWTWVGPFDDDHGNGFHSTLFEIERVMMSTGMPPNGNETYVGKHGAPVRWHSYLDSDQAGAPHLPISALLPTRDLNTGSVAFAMARIYCEAAAGCTRRVQVSMSDRGRVWLLSATGTPAATEVLVDDLLHGLVADEQQATVAVRQGWSVLLVKTVNTFAADTIAVNGTRATGWGMIAPIPGVLGLLNGTNEWGIAMSVR